MNMRGEWSYDGYEGEERHVDERMLIVIVLDTTSRTSEDECKW
jgi:hypothetical protein